MFYIKDSGVFINPNQVASAKPIVRQEGNRFILVLRVNAINLKDQQEITLNETENISDIVNLFSHSAYYAMQMIHHKVREKDCIEQIMQQLIEIGAFMAENMPSKSSVLDFILNSQKD
jgi:hypothetical protein